PDPLVGRVHDLLEILIGHDPSREARPRADETSADRHAPSRVELVTGGRRSDSSGTSWPPMAGLFTAVASAPSEAARSSTSCASMAVFTRASTKVRATRIALRMLLADDEPCPMKTGRATPSSG